MTNCNKISNIILKDLLEYYLQTKKEVFLISNGKLKKPCNIHAYKITYNKYGYILSYYEGDIYEEYIQENIFNILNNIERNLNNYNLTYEIIDNSKTLLGMVSKINNIFITKHKNDFLLEQHNTEYQLNNNIIYSLYPINKF